MTSETRQRADAIWIVTDGRPGNENPARGLAEAARALAAAEGHALDLVVKKIDLRPIADWAPPALWPLLERARAGDADWPFSALSAQSDALTAPWPRLAIGAGRRSAPFVAAIRRRGARGVQILNPQMALSRFDLVVAPSHDRLMGENVLSTVGALGRVNRAALAETPPDPRLGGLERPRIAALIGGPSRSAEVGAAEEDALLASLGALAEGGAGLAITASRRTSARLQSALAAAAPGWGAFFWDGAPPNPYLAMLAAADAAIVTADSVNMASEAAAAEIPLWIAPTARLGGKLQRFHAALAAHGAAAPLPAPPLAPAALLDRPIRPLDDMARAARRVADLLTAPAHAISGGKT